jgi:hypothetical protein
MHQLLMSSKFSCWWCRKGGADKVVPCAGGKGDCIWHVLPCADVDYPDSWRLAAVGNVLDSAGGSAETFCARIQLEVKEGCVMHKPSVTSMMHGMVCQL